MSLPLSFSVTFATILIEVKQGMESKAEVLCKSATVKVSLNISEEFLNMFADDYVFTVSNGIGGVIYVKKEDLSSIYLSIPCFTSIEELPSK